MTQSTVAIFDKKREEKKLEDIAVMLLIDESGSMKGEKEKMARDAAIIFAEALHQLQIPFYAIGFSADGEENMKFYDVIHHHYVTWDSQRYGLAAMQAYFHTNFDGYSIRNASYILRKRKETNKILFVISDGYPASRMYSSFKEGIRDTTNSIREASTDIHVLGIGIGGGNTSIFKKMYNGSFVEAKPEELSHVLSKEFKIILRKIMRK